MNLFRQSLPALFGLLVFSFSASAQVNPLATVSGFTGRSIDISAGDEARLLLYKGPEYYNYAPTIANGHPFFLTGDFQTGRVVYENVLYENVPLLYDIVQDELILEHYDGFYKIQLNKADVSAFSMNGHSFIHLKTGNQGSTTPAGFYEVLYQGKTSLYARRTKSIRERNVQVQVVRDAKSSDQYFIQTASGLLAIKNLKAALKIMDSHADAIRQHLKSRDLNYKRDPQQTLIEAVKYYDQISSK